MTRSLWFFVTGTPAPQGSKKGFVRGGRAVLVESSAKVKPWREDVRAAAQEAAGPDWVPFGGAVVVHVTFWLKRPLSAPKTTRTLPTTKPDLDKLIRSTMDALTSAGVYRDDSIAVDIQIAKRYIHSERLRRDGEPSTTGADITVMEVTE